MIAAFLGVIGSGKDHRAQQLNPALFRRVDFKDELLDIAGDLVGYDVREEYDWFKTAIVGMRRPRNPLGEGMVASVTKELQSRHPSLVTGRVLLQRLGTEVMRKRDRDYWVKAWERRAAEAERAGFNVAVADCRFMNEVACLQRRGAHFTFCDYRSPRYDPKAPHESEYLAQRLLARGFKDGDDLTHFLGQARAEATP